MRWLVFTLLAFAIPAAAEEPPVRISAGYSFAQYLDHVGDDAPLGFYLSIASNSRVGAEADFGYHRDTYLFDGFDQPLDRSRTDYYYPTERILSRVTAMVGPRVRADYGRLQPYSHLLVGMSYAWLSSLGSDADLALTVGGGVDVETGSPLLFRFAVDYQLLRDENTSRALRLSAGLAF